MRALNAVGHLFEPFASGLRALYAVGHFFEPRASCVRALYAFGHYFEPLASGCVHSLRPVSPPRKDDLILSRQCSMVLQWLCVYYQREFSTCVPFTHFTYVASI